MPKNNRGSTNRLEERHFAQAVRSIAQARKANLEHIERHFAERPDIRSKMESLTSAGLDPFAFLDVISAPGLLRIDEKDSRDQLLAEAFSFCELDHRKPMHWRILLDALVQACFRGPGKPPKWNEQGYYDLLIDIRALQGSSSISDIEIARKLKQGKTRTKYSHVSVSRLRRLVAQTLDPTVNPLAEMKNEDLITFRAEWAERELGLPADIAIARQKDAMEALVLEDVVKPFFAKTLKGGESLTAAEWLELLPNAKGLAAVLVEMTLLTRDGSRPDIA